MKYANGREAKDGDHVILIRQCNPKSGFLYAIRPGTDTSNARLSEISLIDQVVTLSECLHIDDVQQAMRPKPSEVGGGQWAGKPKAAQNIGWAVAAIKAGERVRRRGWNGKGMCLWLVRAAAVQAEYLEPHLKALAESQGGAIEELGSVRMLTADGKILTGWLASQTDLLADDWELAE